MRRLIVIITLYTALSIYNQAQVKVDDVETWEITTCPVKLLVGTADFKVTFRFAVKTDTTRSISEVKKLGKHITDKFVDLKLFTKCVNSWRLDAEEEYIVQLGVATIFAERSNFVSISGKNKHVKIYRENSTQ